VLGVRRVVHDSTHRSRLTASFDLPSTTLVSKGAHSHPGSHNLHKRHYVDGQDPLPALPVEDAATPTPAATHRPLDGVSRTHLPRCGISWREFDCRGAPDMHRRGTLGAQTVEDIGSGGGNERAGRRLGTTLRLNVEGVGDSRRAC
jgi:hypothetical protein